MVPAPHFGGQRRDERVDRGHGGAVAALAARVRRGDHVVFMSNGGFEDAPRRLLAALPG